MEWDQNVRKEGITATDSWQAERLQVTTYPRPKEIQVSKGEHLGDDEGISADTFSSQCSGPRASLQSSSTSG